MTAPDVFLSYNRDDLAVARGIAEAFEREGFSVWWDQTLRSAADMNLILRKIWEETPVSA